MIARTFQARAATPDDASAYERHLRDVVFPGLRAIPGHVDARLLRRDREDGIDLLVVTTWDSLGAIRAFAGDDLERAVVEPEAQAVLAAWDERVEHLEVTVSSP
jgi:heme-degrading monooxygenase HmoA